ncbi:hypothetical protein QYE76_066474 [Lolium multiflorum]|uniref:Retrotransposon gag domain-containing protein n=1 Tax=Lolium multiflorum TaxID=4521 RepID=A0AAD8SBF2_LOLMU|nr:hypothetical protein QYE76_066474 [Lolium multiflorum]
MQIRLGLPGVREAKVSLRALLGPYRRRRPPRGRSRSLAGWGTRKRRRSGSARAVGDSDTPGQEEAGNPEESILGNLSPNSDDASSIGTEEYNRLTKELQIGEEADGASSMNTEEFNRKLEELGGGEQADAESAQPMQVLATVAPLDQQETEDEDSNSDPGPSNAGSPLTRERPRKEVLSPEEMVEQARMDLVAKSDILNKPITPDNAADPEALEARRKEMLATAKKFANTAAAMLEERTEAANFVVHFQKKDREVDESGESQAAPKGMGGKVACAQEEVDRIAREAIPPRKITFATPTEQQPLTTPKDNMKKAAELLKKKDEEIDINYVRKLVASAMQQQSKADTSRRLESNPDHCISTAQKDALASQHRDGESRTGSTERRRKVREHPNPIPLHVLRYPLDVAVLPETPGPMGQVESTSATTCHRLGTGAGSVRRSHAGAGTKTASLSLVGTKNASLSLAEAKGARSRNEERAPEPRRSRNDGGDHHQEEGSHRSRSQPREQRRESEGGRSSYRPPRRSPSPPPSGGGGGGGGGGRRSRSRSKSPGGGPRDARERLNEYRSDYIGPKCFGRMIREEPKPRSLNLKLPGNLKHYDGSERPDTWIEDYYNAVTFAGGTPNIACRMLQLYLIGPARVWLSDLEENTIFCWFDLKKAFENHFRGTYKRPATTSDLQACIQKKGETSRSFLTRWLATRNECENVDNRTAMHAFIGGLQRGGLLRHKLTCLVNANKLTLDEMINIASDHTAADDDAGGDLAATAIPLHQQKKNRDNGVSNSKAEDQTWSP